MDPVLVILLSPPEKCIWCNYLLQNWDVSIQSLLSVYPNLKFPPATEETKKYKYPPIIVHNRTIDTKIFPKDLFNYYVLWTPMIMLIPGESWDKCNQNLSPSNTVKLENVQVMNGKISSHGLEYSQIHDIRKPESFSTWLKETLPGSNIVFYHDLIDKPKKDMICQNLLNLVPYY